MKHLYKFSITGMTCHACEKLITMDLAESGFTPKSINHQSSELTIELDPTEVERVKQVIQQSKTYVVTNAYSVTDVKPVN
ncbi:MAG: cation transporter [Patescibacteria group bacterium]|jgi:cation transport ATPase